MLAFLPKLYTDLNRFAPSILPSLARFMFAAILGRYFFASGLTKLDGFGVSANAYIQILPTAMENAGYNPSELTFFHHLIVFGGTVAEFVLPTLLILGLLTRPAALGMMGFIIVQSLTDLWGHGVDDASFGAWFDKDSASLIMDQRGLWMVLLAIPLFMGAGPFSLDRLYSQRA